MYRFSTILCRQVHYFYGNRTYILPETMITLDRTCDICIKEASILRTYGTFVSFVRKELHIPSTAVICNE